MNNIDNKLNVLFDEWRKRIEKNGGKYFTFDGVMYQNDKTPEQVVQNWEASPKRVLFLLKDQHQFGNGTNWNEDIRYWLKDVEENDNSIRGANRNLKSRFIKNIAYILWGLTKADQSNDWWYEEIEMHHEDAKTLFNTQPFALIECKKEPGGPYCSNNSLNWHLKTYGDLLKREIEILNPNMIVCTNARIYNVVQKMYQAEELINIEGIIYHHKSDTLIFNSYHPSARKKGKDIYERIMYHYRKFLQSEYAKKHLINNQTSGLGVK